MKKFFTLCLSAILIVSLIRYTYVTNKSKNINYAVERYFTTGIFNNYKMYNIDAINLSFSNGSIAVVKVEGIEKKSPNKKVSYNAFVEKNSAGTWKVKKVYPAQTVLKNEY
ncbi:hypothetical protein JMF89_13105 [Clostridiaceae bacterium UIB06]|nr:hypothetical protein [Clostridiaceae bacterium UIB06]